MIAITIIAAATLFMAEPLPPNCGQIRPDITHAYGRGWVVSPSPDDDGPLSVEIPNHDEALGQADRVQHELCKRIKP